MPECHAAETFVNASLAPAAVVPRSALERMPKWLICVPLTLQWLWLALRHGSSTLPSVANPAITAGGLVGEGKLEYFRAMGPVAQAATAVHCAIDAGLATPTMTLQQTLTNAGLAFPLIAKPDLGMCGHGVRLVADAQALDAYVGAFPAGHTIVLQEYLPHSGEAGIFYARHPDQPQGEIIGLALRHFPSVTGDGVSSMAQLVAADPRAQRLLGRPDHECVYDGRVVPPLGQVVRLATIGSTRVGGLYRDGGRWITPALTAAIDAIARDMPDFHFGRFDVRFASLAELGQGRAFKIMEVNGAGSEAIQAWDPDTPLRTAFRTIFAKQALLFAVSAANRRRGHRPIGLLRLAQLHGMQLQLLKRYPPSN